MKVGKIKNKSAAPICLCRHAVCYSIIGNMLPDLTIASLDARNKLIHFPSPANSFIHQLSTDGYQLMAISLSTPLQSAFSMVCFCSLSGIHECTGTL